MQPEVKPVAGSRTSEERNLEGFLSSEVFSVDSQVLAARPVPVARHLWYAGYLPACLKSNPRIRVECLHPPVPGFIQRLVHCEGMHGRACHAGQVGTVIS